MSRDAATGITAAELLACDSPMRLDPEFDGYCPCCHIDGDGFTVDVHCWRTGFNGCACDYSGAHVHVRGITQKEARQIAKHIIKNNGWADHTEWSIVVTSDAGKAT